MSRLLRQHMALIILLFLAVGLGLLSTGLIEAIPELVRKIATELGVTVTAAAVVSFVYENMLRSYMLEDCKAILAGIVNADAGRLGIRAIFASRQEKMGRGGYLLGDLIVQAETELLIFGLALYDVIHEQQETLEKILRQDRSVVKLLLFNASAESALVLEASLGNGRLVATVQNASLAINDLRRRLLRDNPKLKLEVRCYSVVPAFGALLIDRSVPSGRMIVELFGFNAPGAACPGLDLQRVPGGLWDFYARQIDFFWNQAVPLRLDEPTTVPPRGPSA
jgi:hypothetical protein